MRVLIYDGHARRDSEPLAALVCARLARFGINVDRIRHRSAPPGPWSDYTALIANAEYPAELSRQLPCYGKRSKDMPPRPETMRWIEESGLPAMRWGTATSLDDVRALFDRWNADFILLKRSGEWGGNSVSMFDREHARGLQWSPDDDLFCPEVNPDDGDVYKIELFGPELLLGWVSRAPSARSVLIGGKLDGIYGAYGRRELFYWDESILRAASQLGERAWQEGFAHISLDLMKNPDGQFETIEVNLGNAAIWWTCQFPEFRERYARGLHRLLVERHSASDQPTSLAFRARHWLRRLPLAPRILVRKMQGAFWRRRESRLQETKYTSLIR